MTLPALFASCPFSFTEDRAVGSVLGIRVAAEDLAGLADWLSNQNNIPLSLLFATDDRTQNQTFGIHAVFSFDVEHQRVQVSTSVPADHPRYPSVTARVMAAHWYERMIHDMFGIEPEGHPDLRRLVHHENMPDGFHPLRKDVPWNATPDRVDVPYPMHHVEGEGVYEIPVGPIHAGIIEPGHFRFNVVGERIVTLEGKLFFTHKGVEKLMEGKTPEQGLAFVERLSGDMAGSHALACCQALEQAADVEAPERAQQLRSLVCELERLTMHIHDLANIGGMGTGYTFVAANGFRIKERLMRLSEALLGNRFWRGLIVPGGVSQDFNQDQQRAITTTVSDTHVELKKLMDTALSSDAFRERLETTGVLKLDAAIAYGALGLPARASGVNRDVRRDYPYGWYQNLSTQVWTKTAGDVFARYQMRLDELDTSKALIDQILANPVQTDLLVAGSWKDGEGYGGVESWRGEILDYVRLKDGIIDRVVLRDPSFCNWALFGEIGPGNIVPDFPLCNKSLNLSYSGTDL